MNKKKSGCLTVFVITTALAFSSCINDKRFFVDAGTFNISDLEIIKLAGTIVEFNDTIWNPVDIDVKDTLLFLKNRSTEYVYDIYNLNNNEKINACLRIGQGPDEFLYPVIAQSMDDNVWIYDRGAATLKEYLVSDLLSKRQPGSIRNISLNHYLDRVAVLLDGNILASVYRLPRGGFDIYNSDGILLDSIGKFPDLTSRNLSDNEKILSFQNSRFTTNLTDRIFISHVYTDLIEIYDYEGHLIKRMHGPHQIPLVMDTGGTGARLIKGETHHCYAPSANAGNEVFVLYFGELAENFRDKCHKIIVFDWNGKPLRMYELDTHIFTITVDYENKIIYGITDSPEYRIIKFNY